MVLHRTLTLDRRFGLVERRQRRPGDGVDLARDAPHGQAVGAVGGDLQLEDGLAQGQHLGEGRPGGDPVREHHDPRRVVAQGQLGRRQDHPPALDPAQLRHRRAAGRRPEAGRPAARPPRSGPRPRSAPRRRCRPAPPRPGPPRTRAGGRRWGAARPTAPAPPGTCRRLPLASGTPRWWTASTSVPLPDSAPRELIGRQPGVDVVGEPRQGRPHANCSRKRRSPSKKSRRSGTPKRIIAIRSRPQPKAKPV